MPIKSVKSMVDEANAMVETVTPQEAQALAADGAAVIVDIRDVRELQRDGKVPGAFHCPRGMLEFWIDPASPYHKDVFAQDTAFVFYCASAWRSALAARTATEMGLPKVRHMAGGFTAWKEAELPVEMPKPR